jgi:hypothetical protein
LDGLLHGLCGAGRTAHKQGTHRQLWNKSLRKKPMFLPADKTGLLLKESDHLLNKSTAVIQLLFFFFPLFFLFLTEKQIKKKS